MSRNWEETFLKIAELIANHSTCMRINVGCVITQEDRIVSTGYNGTLPGKDHCEDLFKKSNHHDFYKRHREFSRINEVHAEQNSIAYAAKHGIELFGSSLYVTLSPCRDCAKLIVAAGIKKVIYSKTYYREQEGLQILTDNGIIHYELNI